MLDGPRRLVFGAVYAALATLALGACASSYVTGIGQVPEPEQHVGVRRQAVGESKRPAVAIANEEEGAAEKR